jgi:hypothetical protein
MAIENAGDSGAISRPESFIFAQFSRALVGTLGNEKTSEKFFQGPAFRNTPDDDPAAPKDCDTSGRMKLSMAELFIG